MFSAPRWTSATAWILFRADDRVSQLIVTHALGDPEQIRAVFRAACRARRTIVVTRWWLYAANVVRHLLGRSMDIVEIMPHESLTAVRVPDYRYTLWLDERNVPMLRIEGTQLESTVQPLFKFLGVEGRSGAHRGRPSPHPHLPKTRVPDYIDPVTREAVYLPAGALNTDEFKLLLKLRDAQSNRSLTYQEEQQYKTLQGKIGAPIPTQPERMSKAETQRLHELSIKKMANESKGFKNVLGEMEEFEYNRLTAKSSAWHEWSHPDDYRIDDAAKPQIRPRRTAKRVKRHP